jgi:hypothetical protein
MATAHAEMVAAVVAEAEADISENKGSAGSIDSDSGGNIGVGCIGSNGGL